jgi:ribosomal protein S18 acetylase RimI-like enzyme
VRAVVHDAKDRGAGLDIQTQSHNFPAVRLYEQTGFEYMRVEYTFHAWLGD